MKKIIALGLTLLLGTGCAALSAYEKAHPDVVAKARAAAALAQCFDTAVTQYQQQAAAAAADVDGGVPAP